MGEKYTIKQLPVINPRIRIVGITDEEITTENLSDYVIHQNRYLFVGEPYCKVIDKIVPLRKDKKRFQAIVEVNPATYDNMIKKGYLIVGYDDCLVYDAIDIKICYQCCGYHHYQKQCSQKLPRCPRCSGSHDVKNCKSETLQCVKCTLLNTKQSSNLSLTIKRKRNLKLAFFQLNSN